MQLGRTSEERIKVILDGQTSIVSSHKEVKKLIEQFTKSGKLIEFQKLHIDCYLIVTTNAIENEQ